MSTTEVALPMRANERRNSSDSKCKKSSASGGEPNRPQPTIGDGDSMRAGVRGGKGDPMWAISIVDNAEPRRTQLLAGKKEPRCAKSTRNGADPMRVKARKGNKDSK